MKKKSENLRVFSKKTIRQIEVLKRYYTIDLINCSVTIPIHYETTSDFVNTTICDKNSPVINNDFLVNLSNIIHSIPDEFVINVNIKIDDYETYDYNTLKNSIKDELEIFFYDVDKEKNKSGVKVSALVIFGITVLAWLFFLCSHHWIGESGDPLHDLIHEIFYTVGAVVFWEAIYIVFLPSSEYNSVSFDLISRLNSITLLDSKNNVVSKIDRDEMKNNCQRETKHERRSRKALLVAGTSILCLIGYDLTNFIETLLNFNKHPLFCTIAIPVFIVGSIIGVISGIGAVSFYIGKGPFRRIVPFAGAFILVYNIFAILIYTYTHLALGVNGIPYITMSLLSFAVGVIYIIGSKILSKHFKPVIIDINDLKNQNNQSKNND